jgi:hypothetical protein
LLDDPTRKILADSIADLDIDAELRELGTATYLDRPLGAAKRPDEPDRTPLLSYESFSRRIAETRVNELQALGLIDDERRDVLIDRLRRMQIKGVAVSRVPGHGRSGVVALEDAKKAAMDFIFTRTTTSSLKELWRQYDLTPLRRVGPDVATWLDEAKHVLLIRVMRLVDGRPQTVLAAHDVSMTLRAEFSLGEARYLEHGGREFLEDGLKVLAVAGRSVDGVTLPVKEW